MSKGRIGDAKYKLRDQVSWQTPTTDDSLTSPEEMRRKAEEKGYRNGTKIKNLASQLTQWPTPKVEDDEGLNSGMNRSSPSLRTTAHQWATPDVSSDCRQPKPGWTWNGTHWIKEDGTKVQTSLKHQTEHWATPNTRDHKGKSTYTNQAH